MNLTRLSTLRAPALAITAISWFGEHGPYRNYLATDSVCRSLAGLVKLVGPIEGPPVLPRDGQIGVVGGLTAFIPSLAGLYGHEHGARRFAVNNLEAMLHISEFDTGLALESGFTRPRPGINRFGRGYPSGNFQTRQGDATFSQCLVFAWVEGTPRKNTQVFSCDDVAAVEKWKTEQSLRSAWR
mgnify:CR=1 FL=1